LEGWLISNQLKYSLPAHLERIRPLVSCAGRNA